ncbi:homoserine kinase [Tenacibaculum finnmarkense]|uniref:Homoserine kinase n=1 Tax=Tenacibaculum finnmarkense genomovar ulcerans TaxID=2781388 RepID=A0A2I2MB41_9FLAO|nr:homoserine kinase [Tenacibaculum finnmarkense]MBE7697784.1 homoserine kinase [Tenacibaculum finnmarkense genomovar ulcerans]SOU89751.1 Homoserine kinase [Tenacibaculum finnmarkense genomovar ulcerans]
MNYIKIFAPATVANVSCGFDAMGFAVEKMGDEMTFTKTAEKGVKITEITGAKNLTFDATKNAAGVVALAMLEKHPVDFGIEITMHKGFSPGSGLGSSAASSAGAAFGVNELLNKPFSQLEITKFSMLGEQAACGTAIVDNVSAAIYGGFVLVRNYEPLDIVKLPVPKKLRLVAIHPQIEIKTKDAREVLPKDIPLKTAVIQWSNLGGLVSGLHTNNYQLISDSLTDAIAEPARKHLIPHFDLVKNEAIKAGALGAGISGSGPTIFALCKGKKTAKKVKEAIQNAYADKNIDFTLFSSKINTQGIKILETK